MKFLITLCLIISLGTVALSDNGRWVSRADYLLYRESFVYRPQKGKYQSVNVAFPRRGEVNKRNITAIYVYDHFTNHSGAKPYIRLGGPTFKYATINLKSQYSKGINSTVEIYGN